MHVDGKGTVGRYPVLLVRSALRHLRSRLQWGLSELETAAGLTPGNGRALVRALRAEGLIEAREPRNLDHDTIRSHVSPAC
jgi:hypothetical protein